MSKLLTRVTVLIGMLSLASGSFAITDGELDGYDHPHVGILVFGSGNSKKFSPGWRCSGTLLSPTVMLTAGHCTEGAEHAKIWFEPYEADVLAGGYPIGGGTEIDAAEIYDSPNYNPAAFFLNDLGIVILKEPVDLPEYATLPEADVLNQLETSRGLQDQTFTAVGYGLQQINPVFVESRKDRMVARPHLVQINVPGFTGDFSMLLSNNHSTGGTCFGDSGGPNFIGDSNVVGGVTSFGINGNCAGTGGVYRMDRQHDIDWVKSFLIESGGKKGRGGKR